MRARRFDWEFVNDVGMENAITLNDMIVFSLKELGLTDTQIRNDMSKKGKLTVSPTGSKQFEWDGVPMVKVETPFVVVDRDPDTKEMVARVVTTYRVIK